MIKVTYTTSALEGIREIKEKASVVSQKSMKELLLTLNTKIIGKPLEDIYGLNLKGCYAIYFGEESQYRIVFEILGQDKIDILAIGFRESYLVYLDADLEKN
jgi:mRNA-degrading endonuclease RelE of RelBE toxin-antitoxin system